MSLLGDHYRLLVASRKACAEQLAAEKEHGKHAKVISIEDAGQDGDCENAEELCRSSTRTKCQRVGKQLQIRVHAETIRLPDVSLGCAPAGTKPCRVSEQLNPTSRDVSHLRRTETSLFLHMPGRERPPPNLMLLVGALRRALTFSRLAQANSNHPRLISPRQNELPDFPRRLGNKRIVDGAGSEPTAPGTQRFQIVPDVGTQASCACASYHHVDKDLIHRRDPESMEIDGPQHPVVVGGNFKGQIE
ncbi:hypothetical protein MesoLjLa_19170 [Mesorhizobium sp. L-2-11]|nr:hypothetical protein MesoLjLa_19170 [Mesorhizobium sp. L-2-11]